MTENRSQRAAYSPGFFTGYPTTEEVMAAVGDFPRPGSVWRHQKGKDYVVIGPGIREDGWILQVLYQPLASAKAIPIARDASIFMDGRFVPLP